MVSTAGARSPRRVADIATACWRLGITGTITPITTSTITFEITEPVAVTARCRQRIAMEVRAMASVITSLITSLIMGPGLRTA